MLASDVSVTAVSDAVLRRSTVGFYCSFFFAIITDFSAVTLLVGWQEGHLVVCVFKLLTTTFYVHVLHFLQRWSVYIIKNLSVIRLQEILT